MVSALVASALVMAGGAPASAALPTPRPPVAFATAPEAPSPYQAQVSCDPVEKPGAVAIRSLLKATYGKANSGGITRACSVGGASEHKEGRAYDWGLNVNNASDKAMADSFVAWVSGPDAKGVAGGNGHRLGIQYVIWNKRIWNARSGWKAYTGASPHTDHVHISLSWDGAFKRTSWWTGKAVTNRDIGPCQVYVGEPAPKYTKPNYGQCPAPVPRLGGVVAADFDGDGRADVGSYSNGTFVLRMTSGRTARFTFGRNGDVPVAGDWNGDGKAGIGVFRNGTWYLRDALSSGSHNYSFAWGGAGVQPVVGDWDGNRRDEVGIYAGGHWSLRPHTRSGSGGAGTKVVWGKGNEQAVAGDWTGAGRDSIGLYRTGSWVFAASPRTGSPIRLLAFGHTSGAKPLVGDWNGNRTTTAGTTRLAEIAYTNSPTGGPATLTSVPF